MIGDDAIKQAGGFSQVPLSLLLDDSATFDNFFSDGKSAALEALQTCLQEPPKTKNIYPDNETAENLDDGNCEPNFDAELAVAGWYLIWGNTGSGVSHLLQAAAHRASQLSGYAMYLDLAEVKGENAREVLQGFDGFDVLCLDHIDAIAGSRDWEEQLFYLLERLRQRPESRLVIGASAAAKHLSIGLADLQSRLAWATPFRLPDLDDSQKARLLIDRAGKLGLEMKVEVAEFILRRCSRDLAELVELLRRLDKQALVSQRRLTIPWIKSVLAL